MFRTGNASFVPIRFAASKLHMPDLPSWLTFLQRSDLHDGFLYGTPPVGAESVHVQVSDWLRHEEVYICIFKRRDEIRCKGPFKCYVMQMGVGGVRFSGKKRYEGVRFNVICITRGGGWGTISRNKALRNTWMAPNGVFKGSEGRWLNSCDDGFGQIYKCIKCLLKLLGVIYESLFL